MTHPLNPAVHDCCVAFQQTYALERGKGANEHEAEKKAIAAYRRTMPCVSNLAAVRDFIACVTQGMVLGYIHNFEGTKFLYAANVAAGALRREGKIAEKSARDDKPGTEAT
jgi:hypothetical protein